jgi:hypothetical protein
MGPARNPKLRIDGAQLKNGIEYLEYDAKLDYAGNSKQRPLTWLDERKWLLIRSIKGANQ